MGMGRKSMDFNHFATRVTDLESIIAVIPFESVDETLVCDYST